MLATVGYGDYTPVTSAGRIVAGILMMVGVAAFGVFPGCIASSFALRGHQDSEKSVIHELNDQMKKLNERLELMEKEQQGVSSASKDNTK